MSSSIEKLKIEGIFLLIEVWFQFFNKQRLTDSSFEIAFISISDDFNVV